MAVKQKYHEHTKAHLCNSQFGPRNRKADHIIAILLELDIIFAIPLIFHHLGPNRNPFSGFEPKSGPFSGFEPKSGSI